MSPFTTRQLTPSDLPLMRQMLTLLGEAFNEPETFSKAPPDDAYLQRLLARDHFTALVAIKDNVVVGGLAAYTLEKFEQARSEIYIYDLAVDAAHRQQGVATALIRHLQTIGSKSGAYVIFVQADYGDDPAIALYTKLGVREEVLHFDIVVPATKSALEP